MASVFSGAAGVKFGIIKQMHSPENFLLQKTAALLESTDQEEGHHFEVLDPERPSHLFLSDAMETAQTAIELTPPGSQESLKNAVYLEIAGVKASFRLDPRPELEVAQVVASPSSPAGLYRAKIGAQIGENMEDFFTDATGYIEKAPLTPHSGSYYFEFGERNEQFTFRTFNGHLTPLRKIAEIASLAERPDIISLILKKITESWLEADETEFAFTAAYCHKLLGNEMEASSSFNQAIEECSKESFEPNPRIMRMCLAAREVGITTSYPNQRQRSEAFQHLHILDNSMTLRWEFSVFAMINALDGQDKEGAIPALLKSLKEEIELSQRSKRKIPDPREIVPVVRVLATAGRREEAQHYVATYLEEYYALGAYTSFHAKLHLAEAAYKQEQPEFLERLKAEQEIRGSFAQLETAYEEHFQALRDLFEDPDLQEALLPYMDDHLMQLIHGGLGSMSEFDVELFHRVMEAIFRNPGLREVVVSALDDHYEQEDARIELEDSQKALPGLEHEE